MDNKLTHYLCSYKKNVQYTNPDVKAVTSTCNIEKQQYFILHAICNIVDTKTKGMGRTAGEPYGKQQELKFTCRTEHWNSSLPTAM